MSAIATAKSDVDIYVSATQKSLSSHNILTAFSLWRVLKLFTAVLYILIQRLIVLVFKPSPPKRGVSFEPLGRIAIIGAGLTGVSSAAHAISHGFEVILYEKDDRVGGIWANVNSTSGLQLNSMLYRFHPAVIWSRGFPFRDEILGEISKIWKEYDLESRTRLNTPVTSVRRAEALDSEHLPDSETEPKKGGHARWIVNDGVDGIFDAVIATVGTCGTPMWVGFEGMPEGFIQEKKTEAKRAWEQKTNASHDDHDLSTPDEDKEIRDTRKEPGPDTYKGPILHSSQLDHPAAGDVYDKMVVIIGSGASGVEAVETALSRGARKCVMLSRDDKWIIPRNMFIDVLIAMQPFGREMPLSFLWEGFLKRWQYRGVEDLVPPHRGLFEGTPVVNDEFLCHIREGKCEYVRGDTRRLTPRGVLVNVRQRDSKPNGRGEAREIEADVVVLATGFEKPSIDFLPPDLFPEPYARPDLYLQNFSTEDWSILMTNSAYQNAIGTVGHFHIGIYTRILLTLLVDPAARPTSKDMKLWVDVVGFLKRGAKGGALSFFTYMELTIWLIAFHLLRLDRLRWLPFIMFGWGMHPRTD